MPQAQVNVGGDGQPLQKRKPVIELSDSDDEAPLVKVKAQKKPKVEASGSQVQPKTAEELLQELVGAKKDSWKEEDPSVLHAYLKDLRKSKAKAKTAKYELIALNLPRFYEILAEQGLWSHFLWAEKRGLPYYRISPHVEWSTQWPCKCNPLGKVPASVRLDKNNRKYLCCHLKSRGKDKWENGESAPELGQIARQLTVPVQVALFFASRATLPGKLPKGRSRGLRVPLAGVLRAGLEQPDRGRRREGQGAGQGGEGGGEGQASGGGFQRVEGALGKIREDWPAHEAEIQRRSRCGVAEAESLWSRGLQ